MDIRALATASGGSACAENIAPQFSVATRYDLDAILSIARAAYGDRGATPEAAAWVRHSLEDKSIRCLIGSRSFGFILTTRMFWDTDPRAFLLFFAARPRALPRLEPLHLLRELAAYAKSRGCATLEAGTETTFNLTPFLRRLARDKASQVISYNLLRLEL